MRRLIGISAVIAAILALMNSALSADLPVRPISASHRASSQHAFSQRVPRNLVSSSQRALPAYAVSPASWRALPAYAVSPASRRALPTYAVSPASQRALPTYAVSLWLYDAYLRLTPSSRAASSRPTLQAQHVPRYRVSSRRASHRAVAQRALTYRASTEGASTHHASAERPLSTVSIREVDLLERPVAPDCEFKLSGQADSDVNLQLIKLDYESQCYRQSESILRARMERLQNDLKKNLNSSK